MHFLLDENVPVSVADTIRNLGHEVTNIRDYVPAGAADPVVATVSVQIRAVLISFDGDFQKIAPRIPKGARQRFRNLSRISMKCNEPYLSGLHPHPLGLEWAQTGYRGARHGCSRPRRSPHSRIRYPSSSDFSPMMRPAPPTWRKARWGDGFACPHCGTAGEPFHFENRPGVLRCRKCRQNTGLTVGTVMERSHTPLNVWFWAAYLVASQTPGMSAVQFQRQLGLSRYETAFQILHKLRSGMVRPNQDRIGGQPKNHAFLSGLHPHPLGLEWAQTGYRGARHGCSRPRRSPIPAFATRVQRLFPDDAACAAYLEKARWGDGFACPHCGTAGEPFHFENRPGVLRCRKCRQNTGLTVGTVMERSHTPLNVWFWAAYLVASQTPGMSAVQFQRQLGLSRYETAFQILHKLRSGMVRPNQDRIGGQPKNHVEVDETWVGGRTRGEGRGVHHKVPVSCAIEVCHRKPGTKLDNRKDGRYAGRVRLAVVLDRSAESLCGFVESTVAPGSLIVTDDWSGYAGLGKRGYEHFAVAECGDPEVAEQYLPIIHLVFANLKTWLIGIHHGVSHQHLQAYLNEFTFRFNRRFYPFNAFRSLLGIAGDTSAPTYAELYSGEWRHPTCSGHGR